MNPCPCHRRNVLWPIFFLITRAPFYLLAQVFYLLAGIFEILEAVFSKLTETVQHVFGLGWYGEQSPCAYAQDGLPSLSTTKEERHGHL